MGMKFQLELEAIGEGTPPIIRLRHVLKGFLRSWGMRCIGLREISGGDDGRKARAATGGINETTAD